MDKKEKLMKIIAQIKDLYPHLEGVLMEMEDGSDVPRKIAIVTYDDMERIAESYDTDIEEIDELSPQLEFDFDDDGDKNGNGGLLH